LYALDEPLIAADLTCMLDFPEHLFTFGFGPSYLFCPRSAQGQGKMQKDF